MRALSMTQMLEEIKLAQQQLRQGFVDLPNYVRAYDDPEHGYGLEGTSTRDVQCRFNNPFNVSPVYMFFGIAGAKHKAVDKCYFWLRIANTETEDMDCIPSALAFPAFTLMQVPAAEIAAVRAMIASAEPEALAAKDAYALVMKPVSVPWIIITAIKQTGEWTISYASSDGLLALKPTQWNPLEVVALKVTTGHMTRVTEICDYDQTGWRYSHDEFAITASVGQSTGIGSALLKMLAGHDDLFRSLHYCIGGASYRYMLEALSQPKSHHGTASGKLRCLELLSSYEIIPALVEDSLNLTRELRGSRVMGAGDFEGVFYPEGVPRKRLPLPIAIELARAEFAKRGALVNDEHGVEKFNVWSMLLLPRWIVVKDLTPETPAQKAAWTVVQSSDPYVSALTPYDAAGLTDVLLVFIASGVSGLTLRRVVDYQLTDEEPDGTTTQYITRGRFKLLSCSGGLAATIRAIMPMSLEGDPLVPDEELEACEAAESLDASSPACPACALSSLSQPSVEPAGRLSASTTRPSTRCQAMRSTRATAR
jgi:hypothetical protein